MGHVAAVAALGAFFAVEKARDEDWRPLDDLVEGDGLAERVEHTREGLARIVGAPVEPRVGASTASLGLFARLVSPALGAALLGVPGADPTSVRWRPAPTGPLPLCAERWSDDALGATLENVLEPLVTRFCVEHALSTTVVRGNLASAVMGSLRMALVARPDVAHDADLLADRLLATPLLAGTALRRRPFVRASCCLYYRLPGGGYCGDCVLTTR